MKTLTLAPCKIRQRNYANSLKKKTIFFISYNHKHAEYHD